MPAKKPTPLPAKQGRSAITGRFVKPATVKRHPDTTVNETRRNSGKKSR